ncbi:glycosyltransferase family 2 protein [Streptomyces sp. NPDC005134]|uniref:glycosyltransferase family 2 protein n=1 Tax=Streptomyces sp. NPDC005098 TaxID=3154560 RepID=UPI0033BDB3EB
MTLGARPTVGAVIVNYFRTLEAAHLASILVAEHGLAPAHVVVVSNGHSAADRARAEEVLPFGARFVSLPNPGYGAAANHGMAMLHGLVDHAMILTHEVELGPGLPGALSQVLTETTELGIVGPLLLDARDHSRVWSKGGDRTRFRRLPVNRGKGRPATDGAPETEFSSWLDGSVMMVRVDEFLRLGGFFEKMFLYMEDVELGTHYRENGLGCACITGAVAFQAPGGSLDQYLATRNFLWLLAREHRWGTMLWAVADATARILCLGWLKPRGALTRQRRRWRGLREGLRGLKHAYGSSNPARRSTISRRMST